MTGFRYGEKKEEKTAGQCSCITCRNVNANNQNIRKAA